MTDNKILVHIIRYSCEASKNDKNIYKMTLLRKRKKEFFRISHYLFLDELTSLITNNTLH